MSSIVAHRSWVLQPPRDQIPAQGLALIEFYLSLKSTSKAYILMLYNYIVYYDFIIINHSNYLCLIF